MDAELTWASEADFRLVQRKCEEILDKIEWRNTDVFNESTTLAEAVRLVKLGRDGGRDGLRFIKPTTSCFKNWMDYAFVLTMCYNWNKSDRLYTVIRNRVLYTRRSSVAKYVY